jgi:acetyl esterase/lipase
MTSLPILAAILTTVVMARAQSTNSFPLWADGAPGALGESSNDIPTLTVYLPEPGKANGAAMVICPGGGYAHLAPHEGKDYARWLNESGITCFVLKYRLGPAYHHPAMLQDAARAVRTVRARATEWGIDTKRVGIMGSSAGGHLASTLLTHFAAGQSNAVDVIERESSRPDVGILCYAVINLGEFRHGGSRDNLLGTNPPPELVQLLSNELQVTSNTPPCFVWSTEEDKTVPVENSMMFAAALRKNKVPFDLHIYQKGGHGMGLGSRDWNSDKRHPWTRDCEYWLKVQGFVK